MRTSVFAILVKELEVDILVDLMGFTIDSRTGVFAWRSAPIQVNYLGYPGTMGTQYFDYCLGETFAGKVAASLLTAIHLPELITTTPEAFEQMAIELATNPEKLARIKRKLADNRLTTPLFDTKLFTKHIEAAYTAMYVRHKVGLAPDHIIIPNA
jgi:predicted O-linked N-acetylglucosamine transferase (SPINDLY family)